ncbi:MAG: nitroreductase family protein [Ignavibacteria bacterium]|nr:nitroreductase family protein [Ignavibacteria bacterium]
MIEKPAQTSVEINELSRKRWSPRSFDANRPVSRQQIIALCEAARWAPSCYNDQPWKFIICDKFTNKEAYDKLFNCLVEFNQGWAVNAPVLIAVIAANKLSFNGEENRWSGYDCGAAAATIAYEAVRQGLVTHQMGGFDTEKLMKEFSVPENHTPMAVIAVGYQGSPDSLSEQYQNTEKAERSRRPLGENFYMSEWGKAIE